MKSSRSWLLVVLIILVGGGLYIYLGDEERAEVPPASQPATPVQVPPPPAPPAEPEVHYPITPPETAAAPATAEQPAAKPDPDAEAKAVLDRALPTNAFARLILEHFIQRVVVTVDNLPRDKVALRLSPLKPVGGAFLVSGNDPYQIAPENDARYLPYVKIAEEADLHALVTGYRRLYPLFQQAYQDLGYPNGYFNDRLVAVIDNLLAAPEEDGPVALEQPKVLYQFADPGLAQLSAGQKIMVRMGVENERRVKARLRALRELVATGVSSGSAPGSK